MGNDSGERVAASEVGGVIRTRQAGERPGETAYESAGERASERMSKRTNDSVQCVWIHSDPQLREPEAARRTLARAVDDLLRQELPLVGAWCLGDATVGRDAEASERVADDVVRIVGRLQVPVCYVMGNHEMDARRKGIYRFPMYERAREQPGWTTMASLSDFYFSREFCGHRIYFFGDHAGPEGGWWTSHGKVEDDPGGEYPHRPERYRQLRAEIEASELPVLTASHYAHPGGQRPSRLQAALLPLPATVRGHFYGHAHIGDLVHNAERPWDRELPVDRSSVRQYNISALETERSPGRHSAILEFGSGGRLTLRIRCHLDRRWVGRFVVYDPEADSGERIGGKENAGVSPEA